MEQIVRVKQVHGDGTATVVHVRRSACSGDCHTCSGCGAVQEAILIEADNPIGAAAGDLVVITADSAPVLRAAAVLYALPVALFFAGYALGHMLWRKGSLAACAAFGIGIAFAVFYDRFVVKKEKTGYTITGSAEEALLGSVRKGDNNFD